MGHYETLIGGCVLETNIQYNNTYTYTYIHIHIIHIQYTIDTELGIFQDQVDAHNILSASYIK